MSWKLNTFAIVVLAALGVGLAVAGPIQSAKAICPCCQTASAASADTSPVAAAKATDKELIEKQKTCPVTDQPLGSMGKPVKVVVKGRTVFLCCAGCKKKLLANPDTYLKKLDEKKDAK
jgi:hypothetical protein